MSLMRMFCRRSKQPLGEYDKLLTLVKKWKLKVWPGLKVFWPSKDNSAGQSDRKKKKRYECESISNQPIPFQIDRDNHDFHALFQYMFYMWVQNCTLIESFFNKTLNVKHG